MPTKTKTKPKAKAQPKAKAKAQPKAKAKSGEGQATLLALSKIHIPKNTRAGGWEGRVDELAASIKANGLVCPIMVVPLATGDNGQEYELVYGARRFAACKKLNHATIKALIGSTKMTSKDKYIAKLVENKDREDLSPLEEAKAYRRALDEHGFTAKKLAQTIGKTDGHVSQRLAILKMPEKVQDAVASGLISSTHAREINRIKDPKEQEKLVDRAAQLPGPKFKEMIDARLAGDTKGKATKTEPADPKAAPPTHGELKSRQKEVKHVLGKLDKCVRDEADKYKKAHLKGFMLGAAWATHIKGAKLPVAL